MDKRLAIIAEVLNPYQDFLRESKILVDNVFETLKRCDRLTVARSLVGGSIARRTDTRTRGDFQLELELVVFVKNFNRRNEEDILKDFSCALVMKFPGYKQEYLINKNLLQFKLPLTLNGETFRVKFGLMIVKIYKDSPTTIASLPNRTEHASLATTHRHGPRLSYEAVALMKHLETGSISEITLVAKFWDKILQECDPKLDFVCARSYMIELIAIHANLGAPSANNVYQGFLAFLAKMAELDTLVVIFEDYNKIKKIPNAILKQRPLVLDPLDYCYNVAEKIGDENVEKFKAYANKTRRLIKGNRTYPLSVDNFHRIIGFRNDFD